MKTASIKLSDAIRLGTMFGPQIRCAYVDRWPSEGGLVASCAMGAAALAMGDRVGVTMSKHWPWIETMKCASPDGAIRSSAVHNVIIHLNDQAQWTREAIADWVATVEPQEPVVADPAGLALPQAVEE